MAELAEPWDTNLLGAEMIPQILTRGWLVDVPAARWVERLGAGEVITTPEARRLAGKPRGGRGSEELPGKAVAEVIAADRQASGAAPKA